MDDSQNSVVSSAAKRVSSAILSIATAGASPTFPRLRSKPVMIQKRDYDPQCHSCRIRDHPRLCQMIRVVIKYVPEESCRAIRVP